MKKLIFASLALFLGAAFVEAKTPAIDVKGIVVNNIDAAISEDNNLLISMDFDLTKVKIKSNQEYIITPKVTNGKDSVLLQPITFAGRNRFYFHDRNGQNNSFLVRNGKNALYEYRQSVPMQDWMNHSEIDYNVEIDGCCGEPKAKGEEGPLALIDVPQDFMAEFLYIPPKAQGPKVRELKGSAFIDFVVNKTDINADYRSNPRELAKITNTIDTVRNDKDVTIKKISIKGFASPEGPYNNNVRLAKGRTASLKEYVRQLYNFPESIMFTSYEPEDWEGLRKYVANSNIDNKEGILAIIDSDLAPDPKNTKIQTTYPKQYDFLLKNEYPALRHSDYVIEYEVRSYHDVNEILEVLRTQPNKLGQAEFYVAANAFPVGSAEYNNVFDISVRMYPEDPITNLNAANSAMARGDYVSAKEFLGKAGNSEEVTYAKGILAALEKDYDAAESYFALLPDLPQAQKALEQVRKLKSPTNIKTIRGKK
ncbi:MAG: hypothetical protein NC201_04760 [Prevotella sp.]|nr:hypothetical protein [Bacteroides sp.]MCM1366541.1 hypothetical protein [Prevotella sp.]MCM1436851.1 hypothetical protein [Prevotella sp.]